MTDNKMAADARLRDSVIIYSGGLDSTTLLYDERDRVALAVTFDYGSNHAVREIACARHHCGQFGIEHLVFELGFMGRYFHSSLLSGGDAIPSGNYDEENMKSTVVPFRNGIMLSIACGLAESRGLKRVLIANHGGDHAIYPDCRPSFINAMDAAAEMQNVKGFNMIVLGGLLRVRPLVTIENVLQALRKTLPERHHHLIPMNEEALRKGMEIIQPMNP